MNLPPRDLTPDETIERDRRWVYPVMDKVIEGIEAGDTACVRIGIEFIEQDDSFPFGRILKSNTARALRRATLTDQQKHRIRKRVFAMLANGYLPQEYREYAKLVRRIGFRLGDMPLIERSDPRTRRFVNYFRSAANANA